MCFLQKPNVWKSCRFYERVIGGFVNCFTFAAVLTKQRGVAQSVEYASGGRVVAGSSPVTPTLGCLILQTAFFNFYLVLDFGRIFRITNSCKSQSTTHHVTSCWADLFCPLKGLKTLCSRFVSRSKSQRCRTYGALVRSLPVVIATKVPPLWG